MSAIARPAAGDHEGFHRGLVDIADVQALAVQPATEVRHQPELIKRGQRRVAHPSQLDCEPWRMRRQRAGHPHPEQTIHDRSPLQIRRGKRRSRTRDYAELELTKPPGHNGFRRDIGIIGGSA